MKQWEGARRWQTWSSAASMAAGAKSGGKLGRASPNYVKFCHFYGEKKTFLTIGTLLFLQAIANPVLLSS